MFGFKLNAVLAAILSVLAAFIYTACDAPMGMGAPVDTTAPIIVIQTPLDNQYIRNLDKGGAVELSGKWSDDVGVTELQFMDMYRGEGRGVFSRGNGNLEYSINSNGTWTAKIFIEEEGEYRVRVTAYDSFRNSGAAVVNIRIHLKNPWIDEALIRRHPRVSPPIYASLHEIKFYEDLNYLAPGFHREIQSDKLDEFQNEQFTVAVRINDTINVAGSRLIVYDSGGNRLNTEELSPTRGDNVKEPEWDITAEMLEGWKPLYESGPHYISFEVWAWNEANWENGEPIPGGTYLEGYIGGTCWYPESDAPHILVYIPQRAPGEAYISLAPKSQNALILEVFEDDHISEIYADLIPREKMDELRGEQSEDEFILSLETDAARRSQLLSELSLVNLYKGDSPRTQNINLNTGETGEYRLIAFAKDAKKDIYSELDTFNSPQWGAHVPLRVFVVNPDAPIIIVDNPATENIFPALTDGRKFTISGYTIDTLGTEWVQIAWVPASIPNGQAAAETALRAANLQGGQSTITANQIKIWKLPRGQRSILSLNNNNYIKDSFSHEFDIVNDFKFNGDLENNNKLFVIHTFNGDNNEFKSFRLAGYTEKPVITTTYPWRDLMVHDTKSDLTLSMSVSSVIDIAEGGIIIDDITASGNPGFSGAVTFDGESGEYRRFVPKEHIQANFPEGSRRTYRFSARDILGNTSEVNRNVTMSNIPVLQYIRSTNVSDISSGGSSSAATIFGAGDVLNFEAVFSLPVRITKGANGGPRLKLFFNDHADLINYNADPQPGSPQQPGAYADYVEGTEETTMLSFTYTVKKGDESKRLRTSVKPLDMNGALIESVESGGEVRLELSNDVYAKAKLQDRSNIELDGVHPVISRAAFAQPADKKPPYYNNGKTVTLELITSEQVRISGSPAAYLNYTAGPLTTPLEASYVSVDHNANGTSTIYFSYIVKEEEVGIVNEKQLAWAAPWITIDGSNTITDMAGTVGNPLDLASRPADLTGGTGGSAFIDTTPPETPAFTIHSTTAAAGNILTGDAKFHDNIYIRVAGEPGAALYFSTANGNNPEQIAGAYGTIPDADRSNNIKNTYTPSEYIVTAWQEDRAGNRSGNAPSRNVSINSRAPELVGISCAEPDGFYTTGANLEFRLTFERAVTVNAGAGSVLTLKGTADVYNEPSSTQTLNGTFAQGTSSTIFNYNWNVGTNKRLKDIKAQSITFNNLTDEYGNALKPYTGTGIEDANRRPIADVSSFNLNRPALVVDSMGPVILTYNPAAPGAANTQQNGGILSGTKIILTFDKNVAAVAGKTITIRPWGKWAVPPILSAEDFDSVYTYPFTANKEEFQKRLKWIDGNGMPQYTPGTAAQMLAERDRYNYYQFTTHGIKNIGGRVRPDTEPKWVLAFKHDLYDSVTELRDVFNAAKWKWQEIPATATSISGAAVTIDLLESLEPGRIWEVMIEAGAFTDDSGNGSPAIAAGNGYAQNGNYRFWSAGTADPVIRADRYSQGDHFHGIFDPAYNLYEGYGTANRPKVDTRVRIDCETPGATIRYDVIRTSFTPQAATAGPQNNDSPRIFNSTNITPAGFFDHYNVNNTAYTLPGYNPGNPIPNYNSFTNTYTANVNNYIAQGFNFGYGNNLIGNGGSHWGGIQQPLPKDGNGFMAGLLVPNKVNSNGDSALGSDANGAILYNDLTTLGSGVLSGGKVYKNVDANANVTKDNAVFIVNSGNIGRGYFFYAGDAYTAGTGALDNRNATGDDDPRLYSGRRDYIAARAHKNNVNVNGAEHWSGPLLADSNPAYEGVYKTTLIYRQPKGLIMQTDKDDANSFMNADASTYPYKTAAAGTPVGSYRLLVQGFDTPFASTIAGFPLNEYSLGSPPGTTTEFDYFTKQAWRVGNYTSPVAGDFNMTASNHYIWVSWEIVSDWYQKGRLGLSRIGGSATATDNGSLQRFDRNNGAVLCTYGAVTYRFHHYFSGLTDRSGMH